MWPSCSDVKMSKCDVCADLLFCFVNFMLLFWCRSCCCHCCCYSSPFWSEGARAVSWHMEKSKMDLYYNSETIMKLIMNNYKCNETFIIEWGYGNLWIFSLTIWKLNEANKIIMISAWIIIVSWLYFCSFLSFPFKWSQEWLCLRSLPLGNLCFFSRTRYW